MKERPIIMQGWEVREIQEGRKTQTEWCPYGRPGDLLWVQETWCLVLVNGVMGQGAEFATIQFEADFGVLDYRKDWRDFYRDRLNSEAPLTATSIGDMVGEWHPPINMPKKYARLWLRITNIYGKDIGITPREDPRSVQIEFERYEKSSK